MTASNIDLAVSLGYLTLRNPFIVGAGPTARTVDQIKKAEEYGWAAVSFKLAIDPVPYINLPPRYRWLKKKQIHIFTAESRLSPNESLRLLEQAREATSDIVLIPTVTYDGPEREGWALFSKRFENAGAHAIELNMCCPNMSFNIEVTGEHSEKATGASFGTDIVALQKVVKIVTDAVKIPVIVKLTPEGGRIAQAAGVSIEAGAAAVGSTANRLGIPDIDIRNPFGTIYRLQENITLGCLSGPWLRPLALRDTYEMRSALGPEAFVIGSGGVNDLSSAVQQIMVGADALWICTEIMLRGFDWLPKLLEDLKGYMREMGYRRIKDFRDLLHQNIKSSQDLKVYSGQAVVDPKQCTSCGLCWNIGHCRAITHPDGVTTIDPESCLACSTCVDICPQGALTMVRA